MPAARSDERSGKGLVNGVRSSPRKRKQQPEHGEEDASSLPTPKTKVRRATSDHPSDPLKEAVSSKRSEARKATKKPAGSSSILELKENAAHSKAEELSSKNVKLEDSVAIRIKDEASPVPRKVNRETKPKVSTPESDGAEIREDPPISAKKTKNSKTAISKSVEADQDHQINGESPKKVPRKRKTKEEKEAEAMPLAARTNGIRMFVGAHVSMAGGIQKSVDNCLHIGGNAFALFLQSQRKWENPPLADENRDAFRSMCKDHKYDATKHIMPHGSYLVNLAQEEQTRAKQAYDFFLGDLKRCEALGIKLYNFHPGAAGQGSMAEAISRLASKLNTALAEVHAVTPLLETMCGSGSVIGSRFSDLRDVIAKIKPEFKSRVGVCLDTCHVFAAGYDLRTPESFKKVLQEFDDVIGLKYLKGLHINDSKAPFNSHRDLHQNIGLGFLGLRAFHNVMNEPRFQNLPLILETPCDKPDPSDPTGKKVIEDKGSWAREIKLLESLIGMDPEGEEFQKLEKELSDKGKAEREKVQKQIDARGEKAQKKSEKGQRSLLEMMGKKKKKGTKSPILSDEEEVE